MKNMHIISQLCMIISHDISGTIHLLLVLFIQENLGYINGFDLEVACFDGSQLWQVKIWM